MNIKQFQTELDNQVRKICDAQRLNYNADGDRGFAFQLWVANLLRRHDPLIETDPDEAALRTKDLGIDLVLENSESQNLYLVQCKNYGTGRGARGRPIEEDAVLSFAQRYEHVADKKHSRTHGGIRAREVLRDASDRIGSGWSVLMYFIATGSMNSRIADSVAKFNADAKKAKRSVELVVFDFTELKRLFVETESQLERIPDSIELQLPSKSFFEKRDPHPTIVAAVKGSWLKQLYQTHRQSLFSYNIRGYLGSRSINREIAETAENNAEHFFYFNNGISAVCKDYEITGNVVRAEKMQIINGAQTLGALHHTTTLPDSLEVLFRLTKTKETNIERGLNRDIIQYNNTQNAIRLSDFRSNDEIQRWLETKFAAIKYPSLGSILYVRKRGQHIGRPNVLRLEELAKLLYCFYNAPLRVYERPRDLWTPEEESGGCYYKIFGVNGKSAPLWPAEQWEWALVCLLVERRIADAVALDKRQGQHYMHRLRFHLLSLVGFCLRNRIPQVVPEKLLKEGSSFDEVWNWCWASCHSKLNDDFTEKEEEMSLHAYMRSEERWVKVRKKLARQLYLTEADSATKGTD